VTIEEICNHDLDIGKQGDGELAEYLGIDIYQLKDGSTDMNMESSSKLSKECIYRMPTLSTPLLGNC